MSRFRDRHGRTGPGLVLFFAALVAAACTGGSAKESEAERLPVLTIFVYDRSGSVSNYQLALARELTNARIGALTHDDRIAAVQVLRESLDERPERWWQEVPGRQWKDREVARDSVIRERFLRDAKAYLAAFTDTTSREQINATDILSTLHDVSAIVRASPEHRPILYLFSDMLQANRALNMERPAGTELTPWIRDAAADGKLPDLSGVCVVAAGARTDTDAGQRVKRFWKEYFDAAGATLTDANYQYRPVRLSEQPCPGMR